MVIFEKRKGKGPFRAKNGKMAQKDPKMVIFGRKKLPVSVILGQNWENGHFGPKMGKWHKKTQKMAIFGRKRKKLKMGYLGPKMGKWPFRAKNGKMAQKDPKMTKQI